MPKSKRKNKAAAPKEVQELFRQLQIEKREAREYFRRLATKGGRISEYRLVTWLSNNSRPLAGERQYA